MEKNAFIFDINKCVGCYACTAGCTIENGTNIPLNWREINTYNKIKHPSLPVFHFSLACNHCEDAPCMKNCPALAYSRDEATGAVIHHAEACIGCTYCTWACPYDAPKFNSETYVVEKCDFCVDRISKEIKPACVQACPVGALDFGKKEIKDDHYLVPGFVNTGIRPSIYIVPLRTKNTSPRIENLDAINILASENRSEYQSKISLKKEWPLVLFTLVMAGLVSWLTASVMYDVKILPLVFGALALSGIGLTTIHIGKKFRLWRFILNLKNSWLSREIVSFSAFLGLAGVYMLSSEKLFGYLAIVFGALSLISADMVYKFFRRKERVKGHSAMIWLTGLFFLAWISGLSVVCSLVALVKTDWYLQRKYSFHKQGIPVFPVISAIRIISLVLPIILMFVVKDFNLLAGFLILLSGELIDRAEYYHEADVVNPKGLLDDLTKITM